MSHTFFKPPNNCEALSEVSCMHTMQLYNLFITLKSYIHAPSVVDAKNNTKVQFKHLKFKPSFVVSADHRVMW